MEENKNEMCYVCNSHSNKCCGKYHHQYGILRWFLFIVAVMMVFALGMKVGQLQGLLESELGSYGHMRFNNPMMYQVWGESVPTTGAIMISQPALKK
jgi:hypothetical protein